MIEDIVTPQPGLKVYPSDGRVSQNTAAYHNESLRADWIILFYEPIGRVAPLSFNWS